MALTDKLTAIADGFRASRGTTEKYSLEQMAVLAAEPAGGGNCDGKHIIEVDTLPTENIDENAVYLCGGAYYTYCTKLADILLLRESLADLLPGITFAYHYATTKPTDNIAVTDKVYNIYYIADENNLFLYGNFAGNGENVWVTGSEAFNQAYGLNPTFAGVVSDASEVTSYDLWAVVQTGWTKYLTPADTLAITQNGTHDVSAYAKATVDVPIPDDYVPDGYIKPTGTLTITENGTHDVSGYASADVNVPGEVLDEYDGTITIL
jgi:hypothetical protein